MGKKRSCQDVKVPRPLNELEGRLYGWVEEAVLTQPSVTESDSLPKFCRNFPLMEESGMEGDYVLEAAGPSDRVPFRTDKGSPHFLLVYQELFTRLRVRLPFLDFQTDVMTRCQVAVSQLHLNEWGFILTFERVCLHYGFRLTIRLFFYIYDVLIPPTGFGYISFQARQGPFWLDHENNPFSWVYWNSEVKDFAVYNLEHLEMAAFKFFVSLPADLPKKNKFICRWILDSSDAEVGKFLDDLLDVKMKKTKLDNLLAMMADPARMAPRAILPTGRPSATTIIAAATAAASAAGPTPAESSSQMPHASTASAAQNAKNQSTKRERPKVINLEGEEGVKEDPSADLQRKRQKKKGKEDDAFDRALGEDFSWKHEVNPIDVTFPENFNYRKALDVGLTSTSVRESLVKMPPEQLFGESYHYSAKSLACLQIL
ncbi:hypothetical protein PIB30_010132 [Stylosanthes scabra]|uniref:Uncharacterized protein n=1 Tax=Stylosanthes scabra TaxID=79078 RepID=A0ABU6Z241_9FABA|nr:hypothetical protein [Stylosanthes scabra]